jgi:hypothetical protein
MRRLKVRPLTIEGIASCYPIWRLELPTLAPDRWRGFAEKQLESKCEKECGILVAEDDRDCVLGVLIYEIEEDLHHERLFNVVSIVAHDLFPSARKQVANALIEGAEQLARSRSCQSFRTTLYLSEPDPSSHWLAQQLLTDGHRHVACNLLKELESASDGLRNYN